MTARRYGSLGLIALLCSLMSWAIPTTYAAFNSRTNNNGNMFAATSIAQPGTPTSVHAVSTSGDVTLTWTTSTSTFVTSYDVKRSIAPSGTYSTIGNVLAGACGATTCTFTDNTTSYNVQRYYRVDAKYENWTRESGTDDALSMPPTSATDTTGTTSSSTLRSINYTNSTTEATAVGDNGTILRTTNSGATWTQQVSGVTSRLNGFNLRSSSIFYAVGAGGVVRRTSDSGSTWTAATMPASFTADLYGVRYGLTGNQTWVAGASGSILKTTNGTTFVSMASPDTSVTFTAVRFRTKDLGWLFGTSGSVFYTANGDSATPTWTAGNVPAGFEEDLLGSSMPTDTVGWATGTNGSILKTTDGGATWTAQASGTTVNLNAIAASSSTHAWVIGDDGTILVTTNGGSTWTAQASGTTKDLYALTGSGTTTAIVVGEDGVILRTTNGTTWSIVTGAAPTVTNVDLNDDVRYTPGTAWNTSSFGANCTGQRLTFGFSPTFGPDSNTVKTVVSMQLQTSSMSASYRILVSPDAGTNWTAFSVTTPAPVNTDVTRTVDVSSVVDTPAKATAMRLCFQGSIASGTATSPIDLVHVDVDRAS